MAKTELKIERAGLAKDADVRLTLTVPWDRMAHAIMEEMRRDGPDGDHVLIGGTIPALVELVAREHPWALCAPLYDLLAERREYARRAGQMDTELFVKLAVAQRLLDVLRHCEYEASKRDAA